MIHSFKAKNFYSIKDEIEVNFESSSDVSIGSPEFYSGAPLGKKLTKIAFIGGQNASGKTNVLRVLAFLRYLIVDSARAGARGDIPFKSFASEQGKPSVLSVSFSIDEDNIYTYEVSFLPERILSERLEKTYFKLERIAKATVFRRKWCGHDGKYDFKLSEDLVAIENLTQLNAVLNLNTKSSAISLLSNFDEEDGVLRRIVLTWNNVFSNIMQFGSAESEGSLTRFSAAVLREMYEDSRLSIEINKILKKYDIGFAGINKHEESSTNRNQVFYDISHKYGDQSFDIDLAMESNGTKRIIVLMRYILGALLTGGVAVIDELDAFLHPDVYDDIISMFMSANINKNSAQLIFSSHNYTILSCLDKQQITLSDRGEDGGTEAWRLDDIKGIRPDDNFYTKYLAGVYGGKPNIRYEES